MTNRLYSSGPTTNRSIITFLQPYFSTNTSTTMSLHETPLPTHQDQVAQLEQADGHLVGESAFDGMRSSPQVSPPPFQLISSDSPPIVGAESGEKSTMEMGPESEIDLTSAPTQRTARTSTNVVQKQAVSTSAPPLQLTGEIPLTEKALGESIVKGVNDLNSGHSHDKGVHYAHNYRRYAQKYKTDPVKNASYKPYADFWKEDYWKGYANPKYFTRTGTFQWELKPKVSAAEAIQSWYNGLTISECNTAIVVDYINTMRKGLGDKKFDELYSSKYGPPKKKMMVISSVSSATPLEGNLTNSAAVKTPGKAGARNVKEGEWHYFWNHPKYLLKHPGGAFQGENAVYMGMEGGKQKWAGLGVSPVTEVEMMETMAGAYNSGRNDRDYQILVQTHITSSKIDKTKTWEQNYNDNLSSIPEKYRHDKGHFKKTVTANDILTDPAYKLGNYTRKGGFAPEYGNKIDHEALKKL